MVKTAANVGLALFALGLLIAGGITYYFMLL